MAWYEVTRRDRNMPFVVGEIEKEHYTDRPNEYKVVPLAPIADELGKHLQGEDSQDVDALASVIDHNVWNTELHDEDREFARDSARFVLKKFHVYPKAKRAYRNAR